MIPLTLAILSALVVAFQSRRAIPLIDYGYQIENAYRIYLGQIPYKDFFLALTPGTYAVTAAILSVSKDLLLFYCMAIAGITILLTYLILKIFSHNAFVNLFLVLPLLFAGYAIFPFPLYDIDAGFAILVSLFFLLRPQTHPFLMGLTVGIPFLFKQQMGFVYFASTILVFVILSIKHPNNRKTILLILGTIMVPLLFFLWLFSSGALSSFVYQTIIHPQANKDLWYHVREMENLLSFRLYEDTITIAWTALSIAVIITSVIRFFRSKTGPETFLALVPVILLFTAHATFLAHGFVGSSYGIWPLFIIMAAMITPHRKWQIPIIVCSLVLSAILAEALISQRRLTGYITINGPYVSNMNAMISHTRNSILDTDIIAFIPGEDPFFSLTKRNNPLPFSQMNDATFDSSPADVARLLDEKDVRWVIVKTVFQSKFGFVDLAPYVREIREKYQLETQLTGYDIYHRMANVL